MPDNIPGMLAMMRNFVTEPSVKSLQAVLVDRPAIIVSAGSLVSAANFVVSKSVSAKSIVMMRPSAIPLDLFDLIVLPEHDRRQGLPQNVVFTPVALSYFDENRMNAASETIESRFGATSLHGYPLALIIGGVSPYFSMSKEVIVDLAGSCWTWAARTEHGMMVTTSRRTPEDVESALGEKLAGRRFENVHVVWGRKDPFNPLPALLPRACAVVVTEDSISMISEAILQGHCPLVIRLPQRKHSRKLARFQRYLVQAGMARWIEASMVAEILDTEMEDVTRGPAIDLGKIKDEIVRKLKLDERR